MKTLYEKMRDNRHKVEAAKAKRRWAEEAERQAKQAEAIRRWQQTGYAEVQLTPQTD